MVPLACSFFLHRLINSTTLSSTFPVVASTAPRLIDLRRENISIIVPAENRVGRELCNVYRYEQNIAS